MIRWLRWNLLCLRGRRCADLIFDPSLGPAVSAEAIGMSAVLWFECQGCGTKYRREGLITGPDSVVHMDRVRVG